MASKTVTRSIVCGTRLLLPSSGVVKVVLRGIYGNLDFSLDPCTMDGKQPLVIKRTHFTKASMLKHQSTNRGHYFYFSYTHGTVILPGHRSQAKFQPLQREKAFPLISQLFQDPEYWSSSAERTRDLHAKIELSTD